MWAIRMAHEAQLCADGHGSCFVTLTYRDPIECTPDQVEGKHHIPDDWNLKKRDVQLFLKRLRKEFSDRKIRYYHCGEYGYRCIHGLDLKKVKCPMCNVGRPHYHACLFNVRFDDLESFSTSRSTGEPIYTSKKLESLWKKGFVQVGDLTVQSAGYTARYCLKKVTGKPQEEHYTRIELDGTITKLEPEYATMSNGIGKEWYEKYKGDVFPSNQVPVPGEEPYPQVPRYYDEKLRVEDEGLYELMKEKRLDHMLKNPGEYTPERLYAKYGVKKAQIENLDRS